LSRILHQGAFTIAEHAGVTVQSVGMSVFRLPRAASQWRALKRIYRHRFDDHPGPSHIRWTRGKGIVGVCWREQSPIYRDLRKVAVQARRRGVEHIDPALLSRTCGSTMTKVESERIIGKYAEVYAEPINNPSGNMIEILVVDLPFDSSVNGASRLNRPPVEKAIVSVAVLVGRLLG
jgi:hypothetical protein